MNTKEKILHQARLLFNEKGHTEVKVREIARALGISPGNLSYHFHKKEDLLIALISQHRHNVDKAYKTYFDDRATMERFLLMVHTIFKSHYYYRGLFMSSLSIRKILEIKNFNYAESYSKRIREARQVFENLVSEKQMNANSADLDFLVAFFTLFIRFSMLEAHFMELRRNEQDVLKHYMDMIRHQIRLFATPEGIDSIEHFTLPGD